MWYSFNWKDLGKWGGLVTKFIPEITTSSQLWKAILRLLWGWEWVRENVAPSLPWGCKALFPSPSWHSTQCTFWDNVHGKRFYAVCDAGLQVCTGLPWESVSLFWECSVNYSKSQEFFSPPPLADRSVFLTSPSPFLRVVVAHERRCGMCSNCITPWEDKKHNFGQHCSKSSTTNRHFTTRHCRWWLFSSERQRRSVGVI